MNAPDTFLQQEQGDAAFRKLMSAPVSAPRKRIRRAKVEVSESIDIAGKSLADIIRGRGKPYRSILSKPMPTYRQWLNRVAGSHDAASEDARTKAEWAEIRSHPFVAAVMGGQWAASPRVVARIMARIARVRAAADPAPLPASAPLAAFLPKSTSRKSWPSYRAATIAGLIAAGEWQFMADCGLPSIHPGSSPQLRIGLRRADVIALPVPIEAPELREAA